jgi:glycosyltransferase involved in cell wall biosynthesis
VSPAVSVITPVWNAAATLAETVASVRVQTVADWELILVDDGSSDASPALIADLARQDARIRPVGLPENRGTAAARNAGIRVARGRFLAFIDADDLWHPAKIAIQLDHMARTGVPFVFSAYRRVDDVGRPLGAVRVPARITYGDLLKGNVVGCLTAVYDTAHFGKVEMPPLRRRQDYGLWLDLLSRGGEAHGLPQVLADYRVRSGSLSSDRTAALAATWRIYREIAGLSRAHAAYYFLHNIARGTFKRLS